MSGPVLEVRSLGFGYGTKAVGRDVDLEARPREVLCLLGPNGSGKTTLFKTMLGLLPPQAGEVRLDGIALAHLTRPQIARRVAYVPQAHAAHFPFTVIDMVVMGRTAHLGIFASPTQKDRRRTLAALATLGIAELAQAEYTRISGGQRQLALIARSLAQEAPAIIMDEPTASLDFGNQVVVLSEVKRLAAQGLTIVLSTHDPDHAFSVGDRVALLDGGRLIAQGAPRDVLTPEGCARSMVYPLWWNSFPRVRSFVPPTMAFRVSHRPDGCWQSGSTCVRCLILDVRSCRRRACPGQVRVKPKGAHCGGAYASTRETHEW